MAANRKYLGTRNDGMATAASIELNGNYDVRVNLVEYDENSREPGLFLNLRVCHVGRGGECQPTKSGFMLAERFAPELIETIARVAGLKVKVTDGMGVEL